MAITSAQNIHYSGSQYLFFNELTDSIFIKFSLPQSHPIRNLKNGFLVDSSIYRYLLLKFFTITMTRMEHIHKQLTDKIMDSLTFQLHKIQTLNRQNLHPISSNNKWSYIAKIVFNPNPNKSKGLEKLFDEIDSTVSSVKIFSDSNYSSELFTSNYLFCTLQWFKAHFGAGSENLILCIVL